LKWRNFDPHRAASNIISMNIELPSSEIGVADFFENEEITAASNLVAKAPDVLVISFCVGAPKTAKYFAKRLRKKVTEKMIKTLKYKVAIGILSVAREELEAAARSHPITAARMLREPAMCDPHYYRATTSANQEPVVTKVAKTATISRRAAKKVARLADNKKTPTTPQPPTVKKIIQPSGQAEDLPTPKEIEEISALLNADDEQDSLFYS
jgi:hypothetical protein